GRSDRYDGSSRRLCARLQSSCRRPKSPLPPEEAHFRAAHHPDRTACPDLLRPVRSPSGPSRPSEMPVDFTGYWKMLTNENFEEYLRALDVNVALRKIANLLKPDKEIVQEGDHMIIRTLSTFRNYIMDFQVGKEFEEDLTGIDDRKRLAAFEPRSQHLLNGSMPLQPRPEGAAVEEGSKPPVNKGGKLVTWRPQLAPPRCLR
ncbi:RBP1, partial [Cervus elaphus hippelaphus]